MACPLSDRRPTLALAGLVALIALGADRYRPDERQPAPVRPEPVSGTVGSSPASAGWWGGSAGIGLALAAVGGVALLSRRFVPGREIAAGSLRVVGRVNLSTRQAVCLVRAGNRTLIVGTGPNGPPTLLGEWSEPAAPPAEAATAARTARPRPVVVAAPTPSTRPVGFDQRIGDDE